ncbi:MAG: hypothetical protein EOO91_03015 [Pedobacter sp.]|nr:MAG: hypothetical protein EOO91_03015 [Pedobacter sp.]
MKALTVKFHLSSIFLTVAVLFGTAFIPPISPSRNTSTLVNDSLLLRIGVAITTKTLMEKANPVFSERYPSVKFSTVVGQTGAMVDSVITSNVQVAITTRKIKDYEQLKAPMLTATPIGLDGLVLTVAKSNPIISLSFEQIAGIYTGQITNWKQIGGKDLPIVAIGRTKAYDPINLFADFMQLDTKVLPSGLVYSVKGKNNYGNIPIISTATDNDALALLTSAENTITYFPLQVLTAYQAQAHKVKALAFNGVVASHRTVEDGSYFIHRQLNAITLGKPNERTQIMIDFLLGRSGQKLINQAGFLSLKNKK